MGRMFVPTVKGQSLDLIQIMEDLKRRLEFQNSSIQAQAVWKLHEEVKKKKPKNQQISSTPEFAELKLLWEKIGATQNVTAKSCGKVWVELVAEGHAEFNYVMNGMLNQVPTAGNLCGIIQTIADLMVLQVTVLTTQNQVYTCPYSLRTPPHPFITVVTNRPESWMLLQNQVRRLCCHSKSSVQQNAIRMLEPFLKFVLAEPQSNSQYLPVRIALQDILLHVAMTTKDGNVVKAIFSSVVKLLPAFQVKDKQSLGLTTIFVSRSLHCLLGRKNLLEVELKSLSKFALSLYGECRKQNLETDTVMEALTEVGQSHPEVIASEGNIIMISTLLMEAECEESTGLLQLAGKVLAVDKVSISQLSVGMMILPILQILAAPASITTKKWQKKANTTAADVLSQIEAAIKSSDVQKTFTHPDEDATQGAMTTEGHTQQVYAKLCQHFSENPSKICHWLDKLVKILKTMERVPYLLTSLVSDIFTMTTGSAESSKALKVLLTIADVDKVQSTMFLPLLLYQLGKEKQPGHRLDIMKAIPAMAKHKFCVAPILKTIQMFGASPKLQALSIQLLTDLWRLQDRCFPYLLKAITDVAPKRTREPPGPDDVLLAKAKAIRDVCQIRASQHGADLLGSLSDILDECTRDDDGPVAALALEGLYYLCEAEVIDIKSAWSVLGDKLSQDTRAVVKERICSLFSLVPDLEVKTEEYEKYQEYVVRSLWLFVEKETGSVRAAALEALAHFDIQNFKVSHLPEKLTEDFVEQANIVARQQEDPSITVDQILTFIPGVCFTRLLKHLNPTVLKSYEIFLSEIVGKEVANLPRGIHYSSLRRQGAVANQGKAIGSIPEFILQQYEKTKQPGLRPGLAAGILFCYDPPQEVGRDGRPRKHYIITHSKNYQQMFSTLLNEVPVQPSEWHRCMLMPQAWTSFMDRLFSSMLEGRRAEIELQLKRDHISENDAKEKLDVAWLWVRDNLTDTIKSASRGTPTMQGNAVLSLAGLALTVNKYAIGLGQEDFRIAENSRQFKAPSHWLTVVIDTVMSLMDVAYTTKGSLLGMCQQRSVSDRLPASILAQASSILALCQLVPILITVDVDKVFQVIAMVTSKLPGRPDAPSSPVLQFHYGLGMGMFLGRLFEEHFPDVCGSKGMVVIWKALDTYEDCCLSGAENSSGCVLGLGMAMSALCEEGKTESRAHVSSMHDKLLDHYQKTDSGHHTFQALNLCLACTAGAAFSANILQVPQVDVVIDRLMETLSKEMSTGVCLALGMLCYTLYKLGHPNIGEKRRGLYAKWMNSLVMKSTLPMNKVAMLNGLMAMVGSEQTLIPVQSSSSVVSDEVNADEIVKLASEVLAKGSDLGIQSNSAWMLGHLYLSSCAVAETRTSVPPNFSYLPEQSVLRAVVDFLIEAGKLGPEAVSSKEVTLCLESLQHKVTQALPPLNWAGLLTPLMRLNFGTEVQQLCLKLAIQQSGSAPTAAMFLTSWMTQPLFGTLDDSCRFILLDDLPALIKVTAPSVIQGFLDQGYKMSEVKDIHQHLLYGMHQALKVHDLPEAMSKILMEMLNTLYQREINAANLLEHHHLAECLGSVPDTVFDKLTADDFAEPKNHFKSCFVRCYLVAQGRQPMALLNSCIDASFNNSSCDLESVTELLRHTFWHLSKNPKNKMSGTMQQLEWFIELLGHIRNIATGAVILSDKADMNKVIDFALGIVSSAVTMWTSGSAAAILGLNPNLLSSQCITTPAGNIQLSLSSYHGNTLQCLPAFVHGLHPAPWDQVLSKVLDCLSMFISSQSIAVTEENKTFLLRAVLSLRHSGDFRKSAVWTKVLHCL